MLVKTDIVITKDVKGGEFVVCRNALQYIQMQKNWSQLDKLTNMGSIMRTLELVLGVVFSLWYSGVLLQFYPYESWMGVALETVMFVVSFFCMIWSSRALDVKTYSSSSSDTLPLVDMGVTRLSISASLLALVCCLTLNDLVMRLMYMYNVGEGDVIVLWVSSSLLFVLLVMWMKASSVYNCISQIISSGFSGNIKLVVVRA